MANVNAPRGLQLYRASSAPQPLRTCIHQSSDSNTLGKGDAVKTSGTAKAIGNGPTVRTVTRVSAGDAIYGVVEGVEQHTANSSFSLDQTHCPASVDRYVLVRVANNVDEYVIQADDEGATLAVTDVGLNANITGNGGGTTITGCNTSTGQSTMLLDTSTKDTTATLQLKIIDFLPSPDNVIGDTNPKVIVTINNCESSGGTGTAGV